MYGAKNTQKMKSRTKQVSLFAFIGIVGVILLMNAFTSVRAGHVEVATLFGKVQPKVYQNGFHLINPLEKLTVFDVRNKSLLFASVPVPTQDQLTSEIDVRIQYRINAAMTPKILENTGTAQQLVDVKLRSQLYSVLRDVAKTVPKAEDFFDSSTQNKMQDDMQALLSDRLGQYGIEVQQVLLSNTKLPAYIVQAIKSKKVREQQVQQEKAELQRIAIASQQKVAQAKADAEAAAQTAKKTAILAKAEAQKTKTLADAEAYKITKVEKALSKAGKGYIQLQSLNTLAKMAKDPSSKFYFLNGKSSQPFPLLNLNK